MSLKITFVNPNTEQDADKYLPKILAAAVINKLVRNGNEDALQTVLEYDVKSSA